MRRLLPCIFGILAAIAAATPSRARADTGSNPGSSTVQDFIDAARIFYRVVACADDSKFAAEFDASIVGAHCKTLHEKIERFQRRYMKRAIPFIAKWRPAGLPTRVVYPFGDKNPLSFVWEGTVVSAPRVGNSWVFPKRRSSYLS